MRPAGGYVVGLALAVLLLLALSPMRQAVGLLAPAGAGGGVAPALCRAPSGQNKRGSSLAAVPLWCLIIWVICGCVVPSGDFGYCYDNTGYN